MGKLRFREQTCPSSITYGIRSQTCLTQEDKLISLTTWPTYISFWPLIIIYIIVYGTKEGKYCLFPSILFLKIFIGNIYDFFLPKFWPCSWSWCLYSIGSYLNWIRTTDFPICLIFKTSHIWMIWTGMQFCRRGSFQDLFLTWVNPNKPLIALIHCIFFCVSDTYMVSSNNHTSVVRQSMFLFYRWENQGPHRESWLTKVTRLAGG